MTRGACDEVPGRSVSAPRVGAMTMRRLAVAGATALTVIGVVVPTAAQAGAVAPKWVMRGVPAVNDYPLRSASCSGAGCVALASECSVGGCGGLLPAKSFLSANVGVSWKVAPITAAVGNASTVSCGSPLLCAATATKGPIGPKSSSAIIVTVNGGKSWAVHDEPKYELGEAACGSPTACVALGYVKSASSSMTSMGLVTSNGGRSWTVAGFPAKKGHVIAASCGTPTSCVAVGVDATYTKGVAFLSANVGRSWKQVALPAGALGVGTVSCNGLICAATTSTQMLVSKNGGKSWTLHLAPVATGLYFQAASCLTGAICVLVGYQNQVSRTAPAAEVSRNGGASWVKQALPKLIGSLSGLACEATSCVAVGVRLTYVGSTPKAEYPLVLTY